MSTLREQLAEARLLPILTLYSEQQAIDLCQALYDSGVRLVEITMRTPQALNAIRAVREALPALGVAAGTVITTEQMESLASLELAMVISPGLTQRLSDCARDHEMPFLPGVSTASEVLKGLDLGHETFKFFPAESCGGVAALEALHGPFPNVAFCPTGGVDHRNLSDYLSTPNVLCVGGSWMTSSTVIARQDWRMVSGEVARMLGIAEEIQAKNSSGLEDQD